MKLDLVHDIQKAYRKVVESMSRPGHINSINEEASKVDLEIQFYPSTLVLMLMLLDAEVSFKIISENEASMTQLISQLTYAKPETVENANFIFVMKDVNDGELERVLEKAYEGMPSRCSRVHDQTCSKCWIERLQHGVPLGSTALQVT
ncbi:MAG: phosphonate C-P lyase system protein PhnH, partial [Clostridia bacterium]|nr:phosphonate C-P lyase system protein PhnH [Clostridia bacterium]